MFISTELVSYYIKIKGKKYVLVISLLLGWGLLRILSGMVLSKKNKIYLFKKKKSYLTGGILLNLILFGLCKKYVYFIKVRGMGFKGVVIKSKDIVSLKLGFSHRIFFKLVEGIKMHFMKKQLFQFESRNYSQMLNIIYVLKKIQKINVYKKKGIFSKGEIFKLSVSSKKVKF